MSSNCKQFSFNDYDIIGIDLDGTLLRYQLNEMIQLEYDMLCRYLVKQKQYPSALLEKCLDRDFLQKGLVLDVENGNILKLNGNATIIRATHGTTPLTTEQVMERYGAKRQWDISTQFFKDPLSTWNGPLSEKLRTLLDCFDLAVSLVFAQAVDIVDSKARADGRSLPVPYQIWPDILECMIQMYTRENYGTGRSAYFDALQSEPHRYIIRTNKKVLKLIENLRASGKAVFCLTGSNVDFANFTASYAIGENWKELFDCIVCFSKKPGFFTMQRPYLCVKNLAEVPGSEHSLTATLELNATYSQGNWEQLRASLAVKIGKDAHVVRSLYVGDNLIQDVYTPVKHHDLDALAICEEMLAEGERSNYEFAEIVGSTFWGSYFCIDDEPTLWGSIISKYSQMCIPTIDTVAVANPHTHRFFCENSEGYYPKTPKNLK